jgi:small subunit ribosomal protein S17e
MNTLGKERGDKMGKVRTEQVKRLARELLDKYPNKVTTDFANNKQIVTNFTNISSTKLRNRVAGYTTRLAAIIYGSEDSEADEEE